MKEGEIAALTVPDRPKPRTTLFWRYVPEGLVSGKIFDESGMKQLNPLSQWVKSDLEGRGDPPIVNGTLNECVPIQAPE